MTEHTPDPARGAEVLAMDRAHVFHSWSAQRALKPLVVERAEGSCFWDYDGQRYLDFSSQLVNVNIGHQHPRVTAAIAEQAAKLATTRRSTRTRPGERPQPGSRTWRPTAWRRCSSPPAAPTPTRTRSGWRGCTPAAARC